MRFLKPELVGDATYFEDYAKDGLPEDEQSRGYYVNPKRLLRLIDLAAAEHLPLWDFHVENFLDVGAATGHVMQRFHKEANLDVLGIEPSSWCKERVIPQYYWKILWAKFLDVSYALGDSSWDLVFDCISLYSTNSKLLKSTTRELYRVCAKVIVVSLWDQADDALVSLAVTKEELITYLSKVGYAAVVPAKLTNSVVSYDYLIGFKL